MSSNDADRDDETPEVAGADDEDTGAQMAPIVTLTEVAVTTGEEEENVLLDLKSKLYRFDKDVNSWKERGTGTVKLLKHKESGKVRLVMRQSKTLKICANHLVGASIKVSEHAGNDKSCVWHAVDFADGELKEEMFCMRFASVENCKKFMEMVDGIVESLGKEEVKADKDTLETAELLEKLSVDASKAEKADKDAGEAAPAAAAVEKKEDEKPDTDKS